MMRRSLLRKAAQLKHENNLAQQAESGHMEGLSEQGHVTEEQQPSPLSGCNQRGVGVLHQEQICRG